MPSKKSGKVAVTLEITYEIEYDGADELRAAKEALRKGSMLHGGVSAGISGLYRVTKKKAKLK